jgi:hypothetical protein
MAAADSGIIYKSGADTERGMARLVSRRRYKYTNKAHWIEAAKRDGIERGV